jgi:hypothetical protein
MMNTSSVVRPPDLLPRVCMPLAFAVLITILAVPAPGQQQVHRTDEMVEELRLLRLELMESRLIRHLESIRHMEAELKKLADTMQALEKSDAAIAVEAAELDERIQDVSLDSDVRDRLKTAKAEFLARAPGEAHARRTAAQQQAAELLQQMQTQRAQTSRLQESIRRLTERTTATNL